MNDKSQGSDPSPNPPEDGRKLSLDVLRAVAVILMVEQHLGVWLFALGRPGNVLGAGLVGFNLLGGAAAPLFIVLAGAGVALGNQRGSVLVGRGAALFLTGMLLNLLIPSWFSEGSFYVLHLLGVWLALAPLVRSLTNGWVLTLALVALGAGVLGQSWLETAAHLSNEQLRNMALPLAPLRLALLEGHFPLFPWLSLALLGLVAGRAVRAGSPRRLVTMSVVLGLLVLLTQVPRLFLGASALRALPWRALWRFSFYPTTPAFIAGLGAVCLILLFLGEEAEKRGQLRRVQGLVPLGRTSLTLLVVHIYVFREVVGLLGLRNQFGVAETLSAIVSLLLVWSALADVWSRVGYKYSLEWLVRQAGALTSRKLGGGPSPLS